MSHKPPIHTHTHTHNLFHVRTSSFKCVSSVNLADLDVPRSTQSGPGHTFHLAAPVERNCMLFTRIFRVSRHFICGVVPTDHEGPSTKYPLAVASQNLLSAPCGRTAPEEARTRAAPFCPRAIEAAVLDTPTWTMLA